MNSNSSMDIQIIKFLYFQIYEFINIHQERCYEVKFTRFDFFTTLFQSSGIQKWMI